MKRLVDYDPMTGITTWFEYHPETDMTIVGREQDVDGILDLNRHLRNDSDYSKAGIKNDWWHYATIPNILIEKWKTEEGIDVFNKDHGKKLFQKLNSPEYKYLRVTDKVHA